VSTARPQSRLPTNPHLERRTTVSACGFARALTPRARANAAGRLSSDGIYRTRRSCECRQLLLDEQRLALARGLEQLIGLRHLGVDLVERGLERRACRLDWVGGRVTPGPRASRPSWRLHRLARGRPAAPRSGGSRLPCGATDSRCPSYSSAPRGRRRCRQGATSVAQPLRSNLSAFMTAPPRRRPRRRRPRAGRSSAC
jgi:hypothetical protein